MDPVGKEFRSRALGVLEWILGTSLILVLWEALASSNSGGFSLLPRVEEIGRVMVSRSFLSGPGLRGVGRTVEWAISGWGGGLLVTLGAAGLCGRTPILRRSVDFVFIAGRSLPSVVAIPIFAASLGTGRQSTSVCTVFLVAAYSYPSFMATLEESFRASGTVAEALGLTSLSRFRFVVLPAVGRALGGIAVQSYGIGLVVTVAGEMLLSISGSAGYRIAELAWLIRMAELYATVCWLVIGSLLLALGVSRAPRLLVLPARLALRQEMRMLPNVLD